VPKEKVANIQDQLEKLMTKNYYLYQSSRDAYRGYVLSYQSHSLKDCYDVYKLDLQRVAKSFGFAAPPKINLNIKPNPKTKSSDVMTRRKGGSSQDTAVRRFQSDSRQWSK
jgi:ATP-dependent RNA helicase DDX18/HAS1